MCHVIRNRSRHGLAFKLSLFILTSTAVIFLAAFGYNYVYSRDQILRDTRINASIRTQATISKIETILNSAEKIPAYLAHSLTDRSLSLAMLKKQMEDLLTANPEVYGSAVAFEPYAFNGKSKYFSPYLNRQEGGFKMTFLGGETYNYLHLDWYQIPKELKQAIWSEPYFDEGAGNVTMATYSVPFYRYIQNKRVLTGIVTADVSLDWLLDMISRLLPEEMGFAFLISRNGVFISHPNKDYIMQESIFSIAEMHNDPELRRIGRHMTEGGEGFVPLAVSFTGRKAWMYYAPLPSAGWSIGLVFPEEVLFAEIGKLARNVIVIGVIGFVLLLIAIVVISGAITRPLRELTAKATEIAHGNLDVDVPALKTTDEVGELAHSFGNMKIALKEYIGNLAETTAAKERIESELKIAHTIQMSFLPKNFPPFPEEEAFDIYATLEPAKEVGGDLYDFFLLDENHLFFSIGDVSGKGVPAALFMAVTKTLMKGIAKQDAMPSETLASVNKELCIDNESSMFVTLLCGIMNFRSGEVLLANAGHNPPLFAPHKGDLRWLSIPPGFLLGIAEETSYQTITLKLQPGDTLVLYTDGITEAMDGAQQFFTEDRLFNAVKACGHIAPVDIAERILSEVRLFTGDEPLSDDRTLLVLRYKGAGP